MTYWSAGGFKIRDQSAPHFLTFTVVGWIDIFSRLQYRNQIINSMKFCQANKGLKIGAYVIMSNHIHAIWTATDNNLSSIIRDFKRFTSKSIIQEIQVTQTESRKDWLLHMFDQFGRNSSHNKGLKFWTNENHPEEIYSLELLMTKLNYIHENPVRAGLVSSPWDYVYSSAGDYQGRKGLIDIDFLF